MPTPLKLNLCNKGYSLSFADCYLTIENGISGTTVLFKNSISLSTGCADDVTCGDQLKKVNRPNLLIVWGDKIDCCENTKTKVALDPKNFGYDTPQDLADAINQLQGLEIRNIPQFTGFLDNGKPIFRQSFEVEGHTSGDDWSHSLNIDKYLDLKIDSYLPGDPAIKKQLVSNAPALPFTKFFFGDKLTDAIEAVTTDAGYTTLFVALDYTVF